MKKLLAFIFVSIVCANSDAQTTISDSICQHYEGIMSRTVLSWRRSGIPVGTAQDIFNNEKDFKTQVFLYQITREVYADPVAGQEYIQSGRFRKDCLKVHRGY